MRKFIGLAGFVMLGLLPTAALALPCAGFTDVDDTSPFCANVTWLKNRGITLGCTSATLYCPNDFVSRLQMAAFMNRLGDSLFPLTCAAGQVMKWDGLQWACANDAVGAVGGGTVTSVAAGTGLQGSPNPITGAGSLNLSPAYQLPQACSNGQVPKSNGTGGWACGTDTAGTGTVTSVGTGAGLAGGPITGTGTIAIAAGGVTSAMLAQSGCTDGQLLKWSGSAWACAADAAGPASAFVQGGNAFGATAVLGTTDGQAVEVRTNGARVMRYEPRISPNVVGGHVENVVDAGVRGAVIAGGGILQGTDPGFGAAALNRVTDHYGVVGGGAANRAGNANSAPGDAVWATVAGGGSNVAYGGLSTVGGGGSNIAAGSISTVSGGNQNTAGATGVSVGGGEFNESSANATYATVGGGQNNLAAGSYATVPGGHLNLAGSFSLAAGRRAKASYYGAFLWADSTDLDFKVQASEFSGPGSGWLDGANTFNVRATGGVWFVTGVDGTSGRPTVGAFLNSGEGTWNVTSDAASKVDVHPVDPQEVLARALTIEVSRWRYRTAPGIVHIGPMAQDFHRAFAVGSDERSIATVDADGVALAAIQGLNAKVETQAKMIAVQARELEAERMARQAQQHEVDVQLAQRDAEIRTLRDGLARQLAEMAELRATREDITALKAAMAELLRERAGGVTQARLAPAMP